MTVINSVGVFLAKEFHDVVTWIESEEQKIKPVITIAENVLNGLKTFDASIVGQTLEGVLEVTIPASTGIIDAFKLQLPVWLIELKWIENEGNKTLQQQWEDAKVYLDTLSPDVFAVQYNTLKALFTKFFGVNTLDANNPDVGANLNIQQSLLLAQPSHDIKSITG